MDSQQAKDILAMYRPGSEDANDPRFAEALEQVKRDPELARWFERQSALDEAIRRKFGEITVPPGLKTRILAQHATTAPIAWWRTPAWLAGLAAALVLLVVGLGFWLRQQRATGVATYRSEMVRFVSAFYHPDVSAKSFDELRQAFAKLQWPSDYVVPRALESVRVEGGCALTWRGEKVSLLCLEASGEKDVWLFIAKRAALPDAPQTSAPQIAKVGKLTTATWSQADKIYLLACECDEAELKEHL